MTDPKSGRTMANKGCGLGGEGAVEENERTGDRREKKKVGGSCSIIIREQEKEEITKISLKHSGETTEQVGKS